MKKLTRWERKVQIVQVLEFLQHQDGLTMYSIAFWLQMRPSSHLMSILNEMHKDGWLHKAEMKHRRNMRKYLWAASVKGARIARDLAQEFRGPCPNYSLTRKAREGLK